MKIEIAKGRRKCFECESLIEKGEVAGTLPNRNQFGTKTVSYCKTCTITGLMIQKKRIEGQLQKLIKM